MSIMESAPGRPGRGSIASRAAALENKLNSSRERAMIRAQQQTSRNTFLQINVNERLSVSRQLPAIEGSQHNVYMFQVPLRTLIEQHKRTGRQVVTSEYEWNAGGYPCRTVLAVKLLSGAYWVGAYTRANPDGVPRQQWPMRKRIVVKLYNAHGRVAAQLEILTYRSGSRGTEESTKYFRERKSNRNNRENTEYDDGPGLGRMLMKVDEVLDPEKHILSEQGLVTISVEAYSPLKPLCRSRSL